MEAELLQDLESLQTLIQVQGTVMMVHLMTRDLSSDTVAIHLATHADVMSIELAINAGMLFILFWARASVMGEQSTDETGMGNKHGTGVLQHVIDHIRLDILEPAAGAHVLGFSNSRLEAILLIRVPVRPSQHRINHRLDTVQPTAIWQTVIEAQKKRPHRTLSSTVILDGIILHPDGEGPARHKVHVGNNSSPGDVLNPIHNQVSRSHSISIQLASSELNTPGSHSLDQNHRDYSPPTVVPQSSRTPGMVRFSCLCSIPQDFIDHRRILITSGVLVIVVVQRDFQFVSSIGFIRSILASVDLLV
jgi:hypothetical protein